MTKKNKADEATNTAKKILAKHLDEAFGTPGLDMGVGLGDEEDAGLSLDSAGGGLGDIGGDSSAGMSDPLAGDPAGPLGELEDGGMEITGQDQEKPLSPEDESALDEITNKIGGEQPIVIAPKSQVTEAVDTDLHYVPDGNIGAGDPRNEQWFDIMTDIIDKLKEEGSKKDEETKKLKDRADRLEQDVSEVKEKLEESERKYIEVLKQLKVVLSEASTNMAKSNYVWQVLQNPVLSESKRRQAIKDITECQTLNEAKVYYKSVENLSATTNTSPARNHLNNGLQAKLEQHIKEKAASQDAGIIGRNRAVSGGMLDESRLTPEQHRMRELAGIED